MSFLICVATKKELNAIAPTVFAVNNDYAEMCLLQAENDKIFKEDLFFCITGVGPVNAALALGRCIEQASKISPLKAILNIGLAGSYDLDKVPLKSLCVVNEEIWPEYGLHDGNSVIAHAFTYPLWRGDEGTIYDRLRLAAFSDIDSFSDKVLENKFLACKSLTVAGVSASFGRVRQLFNMYNVELENMEGFAVAYACARFGLPCLEIRSVSNKVGPRKKTENDFSGALAVLSSVLSTLNLM